MSHPKNATSEEIDSHYAEYYNRSHDESDHKRWSKPDTPAVDEEPSKKESKKLRKEARKSIRKRHKQAKKDWKEGGKVGDKPKKWL
tara:strand:- start:508 stop:765 length:258 start_codon:yes stop_codon:yes gene_type:complete